MHLVGGKLQQLVVNGILRSDDYKKEEAGLEEKMGKNDVFFLPYLMGERSPHNDTSARGAFIGMRADTTRGEMTLAMLEGVTFALRDCLEAAGRNGVEIGPHQAVWRRRKEPALAQDRGERHEYARRSAADRAGPRLRRSHARQSSAAWEYRSVQEAADAIVHIKETVLPDPGIAAAYEQKYRHFTKLYPALKGLF